MTVLDMIGGAGALGGVFGAVGSGLSRLIGIYELREKRKDRAMDIAHDRDRWDHDLRLIGVQSDAQARQADQALDRADTEGRWTGLEASIAAEAKLTGGYVWVEAVRALVRPVLTVLIWLVFSLLFFTALGARLPAAIREDIVITFVNAVTFSASTALAWWFGDRGPVRPRF
jgi:hypothetical protein